MRVIVEAPSRLHITLIDLNGDMGRIDGGIGVALRDPSLRVEVAEASEDIVPDDLRPVVDLLRSKMGVNTSYRIEIERPLPQHVGLGSRTQTLLAIGKGISLIEGLDYPPREIARIVRRGGTSGIGIAAFERGGFILDGGHSRRVKPDFLPSRASSAPPPPVLFQHPLPEDWYFVLAIPDVEPGAHGEREIDIFKKFCPVPARDVEKISRIILLKILPAIIERDIKAFGEGITAIQNLGFKKVECDLRDKIIKDLFEVLRNSSYGHGMSSFGPTVFGVVDGEGAAKELEHELASFFKERGISGKLIRSCANNKGANCLLVEDNPVKT